AAIRCPSDRYPIIRSALSERRPKQADLAESRRSLLFCAMRTCSQVRRSPSSNELRAIRGGVEFAQSPPRHLLLVITSGYRPWCTCHIWVGIQPPAFWQRLTFAGCSCVVRVATPAGSPTGETGYRSGWPQVRSRKRRRSTNVSCTTE